MSTYFKLSLNFGFVYKQRDFWKKIQQKNNEILIIILSEKICNFFLRLGALRVSVKRYRVCSYQFSCQFSCDTQYFWSFELKNILRVSYKKLVCEL